MNYTRIQCPEPESNQRHEDFQSSALPTELSGQLSCCLISATSILYHISRLLASFFLKNFIYQPDSCFCLKNLAFYGLNCLSGTLLLLQRFTKKICFYKNLIINTVNLIICMVMSDQIADSVCFCFVIL